MPLDWEEDVAPCDGCDEPPRRDDSKPRNYVCPASHCAKPFKTPVAYAIHHVTRHQQEVINFPCVGNDCQEYFPSAKEMADHLTTVHQHDYTVAQQEQMFKLDAIASKIKESANRREASGNKN